MKVPVRGGARGRGSNQQVRLCTAAASVEQSSSAPLSSAPGQMGISELLLLGWRVLVGDWRVQDGAGAPPAQTGVPGSCSCCPQVLGGVNVQDLDRLDSVPSTLASQYSQYGRLRT